MANSKVETDVLMDRLMDIFRSVGYDGASIAHLAQATGLQKASLYHRFPAGKQQMAQAVLEHVAQWNQAQIVDVLHASTPPKTRLTAVLSSINQLYDGGRLSCILRALSHGSAAELFHQPIAAIFSQWIDAFTYLAQDVGFDEQASKQLAESTLIQIQGSLILTQTLRQPAFFEQVLKTIKTDFIVH